MNLNWRNFAVAFLLSFAFLAGWQWFVLRPRQMAPPATTTAAGSPSAKPSAAPSAPIVQKLVEMEFGVNRISFNLQGGEVHQWWVREPADAPRRKWVSLLNEEDDSDRPLRCFSDRAYQLIKVSENKISLKSAPKDGIVVTKTFDISRDAYLNTLAISVHNQSKAPVELDIPLGWGPAVDPLDEGAERPASRRGFFGGGPSTRNFHRVLVYEPPRLINVKKQTSAEGAFGWWAVDNQYFMAAFLNDSNPSSRLEFPHYDKKTAAAVRKMHHAVLGPGQTAEESHRVYVGPKSYDDLVKLNLGLERAVNLGFFATIAKYLHKYLSFLYKGVGNFGWAIVLMTMTIQIIVLPLTIKSFRHGQRMKAIQPHMKRLQELYKNDPRRLNTEMMDLYKRHGLRFMGMEGCIPVLVQMPVFFALYSVLNSSFELRHAPWIGWIQDLSAYDPYHVLPILNGLLMFGQQKITMSSMDPSQKPLMYMMPLMFTFIFMKMPAGLVVYWITNSLVSLGVQLILKKMEENKSPAK